MEDWSLEAYRRRLIRFLDLWEWGSWRFKIYGIGWRGKLPGTELVEAARKVARERLAVIDSRSHHYGVGFMGIHAGKTANFIFIDWWQDENELHHHVYVSQLDTPTQLEYVTPTGLIACVWDLAVLGFEREAWLQAVLKRPEAPDLNDYLQRRLNAEV